MCASATKSTVIRDKDTGNEWKFRNRNLGQPKSNESIPNWAPWSREVDDERGLDFDFEYRLLVASALARCYARTLDMHPSSLSEISFLANGHVDVSQLIALYRLMGWDNRMMRTIPKTEEMLAVSRFYVAASTPSGILVGFARVGGDPYVVQVLDVITHPDFRRRGIATRCMRYVIEHLRSAEYASVTLTDGSGVDGFYERFGFRTLTGAVSRVWVSS